MRRQALRTRPRVAESVAASSLALRTSSALAYSIETEVARLVSRSSTTEIRSTGSVKREAAAVSDYSGAKREPLSHYFRTSVSLKLSTPFCVSLRN